MKDHLVTVGIIAGFILFLAFVILMSSLFPTVLLVIIFSVMTVLCYRSVLDVVRHWNRFK